MQFFLALSITHLKAIDFYLEMCANSSEITKNNIQAHRFVTLLLTSKKCFPNGNNSVRTNDDDTAMPSSSSN